jgi:hypothetical protein
VDIGSPQQVAPPRRRRRWVRRHLWLLLTLIVVGCLLVVTVGLTPWAVHMGGRFTPTLTWDGYGTVKASNGGTYLLFTHLEGGVVRSGSRISCDSFSGCDTLQGTARLCGRDGATDTFELRGEVHAWWSTDGARTSVDLTEGTPRALQDGWVVAFSGMWHGPDLILTDHDNSFTEAFTPHGAIRTITSTDDAGPAAVTLRYGSSAAFDRACRALASAARTTRAGRSGWLAPVGQLPG